METPFTEPPRLTLRIARDSINTFSSLLQAGVRITADPGVSIGAFLSSLPGFDTKYISEEIQTIFLNGSATDDLETSMTDDSPVLAVSAAMPGLAGAIFRKNSLHAALRTTKTRAESSSSGTRITVTLKLFNAIARDRGSELLRRGVTMKAASFAQFLENRTGIAPLIQNIDLQGGPVEKTELPRLLAMLDSVHLTIHD